MSCFCTAKATHIFFSKKFQHICVSLDVNFNKSLTNDIVSFEQLGPVLYHKKNAFSGAILYTGIISEFSQIAFIQKHFLNTKYELTSKNNQRRTERDKKKTRSIKLFNKTEI